MAPLHFIQVILPLKLEWEPYYRLPEGLSVQAGDRVRVLFANSFYVATVSAVDVRPAIEESKIFPIEALEKDLPAVSGEEIRFWRELADYYLCTVGEVYKAAYPQVQNHLSRLKLPEIQAPASGVPLTPEQEKAADAIREAWTKDKPVLLHAGAAGKTDIYLKLALEAVKNGKSVLWLVPEMCPLPERVTKVFPSALTYHSALTAGKRKGVARMLRTGQPCLVVGTRSALFLPFRQLGLVIVDQEQDPFYKQEAPAPRYHARESAILLARIHGAQVLLGSATPSLESIYNAQCKRFVRVDLKECFGNAPAPEIELIDLVAERKKKGMTGSFSLKLLARMKETLEAGQQILLLGPRRIYAQGRQVEDEVLAYFPSARIANLDAGTEEDEAEALRAFSAGELDMLLGSALATKEIPCDRLGLIAVVASDSLLARQDFRADERALQVLEQFRGRCARYVIQTREPGHPVFSRLTDGGDATARMLEERRLFGYPPFTRLIHVELRDSNEKRLAFLSRELVRELGAAAGPVTAADPHEIRILLPRDKQLGARKKALWRCVSAFEQQRKYTGHIIIDVDPV